MFKKVLLLIGVYFLFAPTYSQANNSSNGQDVKQYVERETAQSLQFLMTKFDNEPGVCVRAGVYCNPIAGSVTTSNNMINFNLHHDKGIEFNRSLLNFLENLYVRDGGMVCSQSPPSCSLDDKNCKIALTCKQH
ncbi:hypothetical protein EKO29_17510 [Colwellia sp. Arc7-635]|jgi:hypothetical protein|uniref:hypothetical protein n=1 Tax=Colwellia sp. Arc7-635 TaxID=2497879 RepID=UPI000F85127A|nr:hypothetical protein [Colwellia sp. Arc7-635]AZQ85631.1 hypothetical protein EKO29_17510 [Colwellia sp. Arc7-635]